MTIPVTVAIPVKNDAEALRACLATLQGVAEIVVIDSGSTDDTKGVANEHNARLVQFRWLGGFPKKRNWLLQTYAFQTEWVLFLDADEHLTDAFKVALAEAVQQTSFVGYWLNYRNRFMGRVLKHGIPQRKLALFKVGAGLYERIDDNRWSKLDMEVHEHPVLDGAVSEIREPIDHFGYRGMHHFIDRHNDYSSWEAHRFVALTRKGYSADESMTGRQRRKYRHLDKLWFPFAYFALAYVGRAGFLDGRAGLSYALLKAHYFWQIRQKIREIQANRK